MEKLLFFLSDGKDARTGGGDSYCDRLNCRYTVFVLTIGALVVTSRVQVGDPIQCWCPSHFTASHVSYTNKVSAGGGDVGVCETYVRSISVEENVLQTTTCC